MLETYLVIKRILILLIKLWYQISMNSAIILVRNVSFVRSLKPINKELPLLSIITLDFGTKSLDLRIILSLKQTNYFVLIKQYFHCCPFPMSILMYVIIIDA